MIEDLKQNKLAKAIATLDSMVISIREQQIELAKLLAKDSNQDESMITGVIKQASKEYLKMNGVDW